MAGVFCGRLAAKLVLRLCITTGQWVRGVQDFCFAQYEDTGGNFSKHWVTAMWIKFDASRLDFYNLGLGKPGTQIQTLKEILLIGDMNELGGACDCCAAIHNEEIILRYGILGVADE